MRLTAPLSRPPRTRRYARGCGRLRDPEARRDPLDRRRRSSLEAAPALLFGANVYRATEPGQQLIGEHDELSGGHEELYVVLDGVVRFIVDREHHHCERGDVVAVRDPAIRRAAIAESARASVLAIGKRPADHFEPAWDAARFAGIPTVED